MTVTRMNVWITALFIGLFGIYSFDLPMHDQYPYIPIIIFEVLMLACIWCLYKGIQNSTETMRKLAFFSIASVITLSIGESLRFLGPLFEGWNWIAHVLWLIHILMLSLGLGLVIKKVRTNFQLGHLLFDLHISLTVFGSIGFVTYKHYAANDSYMYEILQPIGTIYVLFILMTLLLVVDKPIKRPVLNGLVLGVSVCTFSSFLLLLDTLDGALYRDKYLFVYGFGIFILSNAFTRKQTHLYKRMQNKFTISYSHWEIIRPLIQYAGVLVLLYEFVFRFRDSNVLFFGMVCTVILVICRDLITILQNQSLVRHLKIFNQQLERKIGERTRELTDSHRELEDAFKQIDYIARHDTFSSLPNRRYLEQMIGWKIQESKQNRTMVALIFIDVDRLKHINDTVGHALGDAVLLKMVERMKENLPEGVFLARHGGDEFAVIIDGIYFEDEVTRNTENLLRTVAHPFQISDKELTITLSIGVALFPDNSDSVEELMKHADLAMYKAKEERQNKVVFYSKEMDHEVVGRMEMLSDLQAAIKRKEFVVHYQPQFDIRSGNLSGVEALVRWQHPTRGFISPGEFIPLAEEFDLIVPIDEFVLDSAMEQFMEWQNQNISPPRLSVNLCPQQFLKGDISEKLKGLLIKHRFPADQLVIEMTESVAMHDEVFLTEQLHEISGMGIQISIDDFGTGYSSLSYVKNYPLDQLKIARPFIMDVPESHSDIAMVKAIIDLSHHFNLTVVVEGVETYEQLQFLRSVHCEEVQGFYFSKPLSPVDMEKQYLLPVKEETTNF